MRDIITQLGTTDFHRLRIGIGHPGHKDLVLDYVLSKPSLQDKKAISEAIEQTIPIIPILLKEPIAVAMNSLNGL